MKSIPSKLILAGLTFVLLAQQAPARAGVGQPAAADTEAGTARSLLALARSDVKNQKALIIARSLPLTAGEADGFWPLHREYELELSRLNDERLGLLENYAANYAVMTDQAAGEIAAARFDLETKYTELKRAYFARFSRVMPATKVVRFMQIEDQLNKALELQVEASVPLSK